MRVQKKSNRVLDKIDLHILSILQLDARIVMKDLAERVGLSLTPCIERVKRMERDGVIAGYTVRVKPQAEAHRIRALMTIVVEGNRGAEVLHALRGHPNVTGLHSTNGRWDLIAELRADSLEAFDRALGNIRLIDGIASTETSLLLSTHKV